jgi:glutamate-ammonia-ligase adenylyltransferase
VKLPAEVTHAIEQAWNRDVAKKSMERWLELCEKEGWKHTPQNLPLLTRIFGASWYFTRFIFVNGSDIADLIDQEPSDDLTALDCTAMLEEALEYGELEACLERLRILKNRVMLQILIAYLRQVFDQARTEYSLTCLAEATLDITARLFRLARENSSNDVTILGMGRMAGYEMTFGSDLDIIFLYDGSGNDMDPRTEKQIRSLLRHIAVQTPAGMLYDVDMRLRPHGNAGVLVTSYKSFLEYHSRERDIWERQMMTRCRPILDVNDDARKLMDRVKRQIYARYDEDHLRSEIVTMRKRVQKELGSPSGKFEIKRGRGGIMDIDFITHYYQLAYGHDQDKLQTCSTRTVLQLASILGFLDSVGSDELLVTYDFLKRVEMSLRLFDMKSISAFPSEPEANTNLARAMGFEDGEEEQFLNHYKSVTNSVRNSFNRILQV